MNSYDRKLPRIRAMPKTTLIVRLYSTTYRYAINAISQARPISHLLQFVVINDILISRAALQEGVQPVHVVHVSPQVHQGLRYLEVGEVLAGDPNVLQPRHQFAVEAAHGVASEKARTLATQMLVDLAQMRHQRRGLGILVLVLCVQQQQLEFLRGRKQKRNGAKLLS